MPDQPDSLVPIPQDLDDFPETLERQAPGQTALYLAGQAANRAATHAIFEDYRSRRSWNTLRRQYGDLGLFERFLAEAGVKTSRDHLISIPDAWRGVTWGLVEGFKRWMLQMGYATGSVNIRLSTIKTYAGLAAKAGIVDPEVYALIRSVNGYSRGEARRIDQKRSRVRVGDKKPAPVRLTPADALTLLDQPQTPQGRRDQLMMCLLLEHGLRCGELAALRVENIDLERGLLQFFRPKVNKEQIHRLTPRTYRAALAYFEHGDVPEGGALLRRSLKNGKLGRVGLTERGLTKRVRFLGKLLGIRGLSAHDCRHYWATRAARSGTDAFALQEAGGWTSLAMPRRYVEAAQIANQGIKGFED